MILTEGRVWHFSFSDVLLRDVQPVHKAELGLNHQAHSGLGLSVLALLSAMPSADWGLSASPASQTPSLLCSVFPGGNTKAAICAFVPVSAFAYLTHTFLLLFLKRKAFFCWFKGRRKLKAISLRWWLTVEKTHSVRCFHGTWTILSEGKTEAICVTNDRMFNLSSSVLSCVLNGLLK